jgi:putative endonuclease
MIHQYFVYILLCNDKSYYTGVTNDIERRMFEHESGENKNCYTYKRRPLKLVFQENFEDVNQAIAFEKQIKGWRREKKEAVIKGDWHLLPDLARTAKENNQTN